MSEKTNKERKCRFCGKTIVGNNKIGICSACKKKAGDTGLNIIGLGSVIGGSIWAIIKAFTKKA